MARWTPLYEDLPIHPKTLRAAAALGMKVSDLCGKLMCLWAWALRVAPDGVIGEPVVVAAAAQWEGDAEVFAAALEAARFLDRTEDGQLSIHQWAEDYGGRVVQSRAKHAAAQGAYRAKQAVRPRVIVTAQEPDGGDTVTVTDTPPSRDDHVMITVRSRDDHVITRHESKERDASLPPLRGAPLSPQGDGQQLALVPVVALTAAQAPPERALQEPVPVERAPPAKKRRPSARSMAPPVYTPEFDEFWAIFPRHEDKGAALVAYQVTIGKIGATHQEIMTATRHYAAAVARRPPDERQFTKYAKTWLGPDQPWRDYLKGDPGPNGGERYFADYRSSAEKAASPRREWRQTYDPNEPRLERRA